MGIVSTELLDKLNKTPIEHGEMLRYMSSVNCSGLQPNFSHSLNVAMHIFKENSNKCFSLNIRLEALNRILSSGDLTGWIDQGDDDESFYIAENVYYAAGIAPLTADGNRFSFNKDSFLQTAFRLGKLNA